MALLFVGMIMEIKRVNVAIKMGCYMAPSIIGMLMEIKKVKVITIMETHQVFGGNGTMMVPESMRNDIRMESLMVLLQVGTIVIGMGKKTMKTSTRITS